MKKLLLLAFLNIVLINVSFSQTDPVLFTVDKVPVTRSEFNYIYQKTNGVKADYSRASVEEYLDLYTKFKMKVKRARDMKLDTIETLREELSGYRRQLAETYLTDREVTDKLIAQAHSRMTNDVLVSHILVTAATNATDTMAAYGRIKEAKMRLDKGESFAKIAKEISEDKATKDKGGEVGYITAMLPDGYYALENAIFGTNKGSYSDIVRTPQGYHIVFVNDVREARGEVEVAHILIRTVKEGVDQPNAKERADSTYNALMGGANFDELATRISEDGYSSPRAGYLGSFGVGRFEPVFENAAFGIDKDGGYSKPVLSRLGYHIIKRISKKPIASLEVQKTRLKAAVQQDGRFAVARQAMLNKIKKDNKATLNTAVLNDLESKLDTTFATYEWKTPTVDGNTTVFTLGGNAVTTNEFLGYLLRNPNERVGGYYQTKSLSKTFKTMTEKFMDDRALAYEEGQLDTKYPEFKALMREYEEGILLFEAIKQNVWDKASQDSTGLEKFFNGRRDKYVWQERAEIVTYSVIDSAKNEVEAIRKYAAKKSPQDVLKKFNKKGKKEIVSFRLETFEKGRNKKIDALGFKVGNLSVNEMDKKDNVTTFQKVQKIIPTTQKLLKEARGFAVADYQDFLEKNWSEDLIKSYQVNVNKEVLNSLIKK
ncbi:MAG: hypothetical protein RL757_3393 [Bacteroidota bacterium]|jgi:peptidyl-prolyl cis-trans isomerase SurA